MVTASRRNVPTAFVSYSWESEEHKAWVRNLATRLRGDGIDVTLDQWDAVPGDDLPQFMERAVRENNYVLIVCTPRYKQRSDTRAGGVGYEGDIMTGEVFTKRNKRKFIPLLRRGDWVDAAPTWIAGKLFVDMRDEAFEAGYNQLFHTMCGTLPKAPPLGKPPVILNVESMDYWERQILRALCFHSAGVELPKLWQEIMHEVSDMMLSWELSRARDSLARLIQNGLVEEKPDGTVQAAIFLARRG
jgi:hypothetical protein